MHKIFNICFRNCPDNLFVELSIGGVEAKNRSWKRLVELPELVGIEGKKDCYFGPALRTKHGIMGKGNFACSHVAWVDYDDTTLPVFLIEPSAIVKSGNGYHLYWRLESVCNDIKILEELNSVLARSIEGDSAHNADRLLRIPGTLNSKYESNNIVEVVKNSPSEYDPYELLLVSTIESGIKKKILTGDRRGFSTRSERDWFIVKGLLKHGLSEEMIINLFENHACGDKTTEHNGEHYLSYTIDKAKEQLAEDAEFLIQRPDGYYAKTRNSLRRVSTFVFNPTLLLVDDDENDSILCDVSADGSTRIWKDTIIPQTVLTTVRNLSKILTKASWAWLGSDADVRLLRAHLVKKLQDDGMPTVKATSTLGYYNTDTDRFFVGTNFVVGNNDDIWGMDERPPIIYTPPPQQIPRIIKRDSDLKSLEFVLNKLHLINTPENFWPMLGWFMASPLKPAIERLGYRFPILNVFGTRGSGKTTTILRVFQPLLGYEQERAYDANTTRFVILSLLGCSNAVPISFSEFRASNTNSFMRYVLLSYDSGRDPRGRSDQSTIDYPLTAPFVIDGEDMLDDSAAMERIIAVHLNPNEIKENTKYWAAFHELQQMNLHAYTIPYIKYIMKVELKSILVRAENDVNETFKSALPPRIRKNLTVAWLGVLLYRSFVESLIEIEWDCGAESLKKCLSNVYSTTLGRAPTAADDFIETIVNAATGGLRLFPWEFAEGAFWFQLTPAFNFYTSQKAKLRKTTLSRDAIKRQLLELLDDYTVEPCVRTLYGKPLLVYGVDLARAHAGGLDIPASISKSTPTINLKKK